MSFRTRNRKCERCERIFSFIPQIGLNEWTCPKCKAEMASVVLPEPSAQIIDRIEHPFKQQAVKRIRASMYEIGFRHYDNAGGKRKPYKTFNDGGE